MGTAGQYGEADLKDRDFSNQVNMRHILRRARLAGLDAQSCSVDIPRARMYSAQWTG